MESLGEHLEPSIISIVRPSLLCKMSLDPFEFVVEDGTKGRRWTINEDKMLCLAVQQHGEGNWSAMNIDGRSGKHTFYIFFLWFDDLQHVSVGR